MLDYYQRPFLFLSKPFVAQIIKQPHPKRKSFWNLVPEQEYTYLKAGELLLAYYNSIQKEIEAIISTRSRMYWLHLSRRVLPSTSGKNKSPITIGITRKIIDAAIEKFGQGNMCESVGITGEIDVSEIFDGLLLSDEFEVERGIIEQGPRRVVLTILIFLSITS
jgi:hypothetical protein